MPHSRFLYVGSNNGADATASSGLWIFRINSGGAPDLVQRCDAREPTSLCIAPHSSRLYAIETLLGAGGLRRSGVSAWSIDPASGLLRLINRSVGTARQAVHIALAAGNTRLVTSNYQDGTFDLFSVGSDGSVGRVIDTVQQSGSGPHPRQAAPHPHMALADPSDRWVLTVDLGLDALELYDAAGNLLERRHRTIGPLGDGLRHAVFHPRLPLLYVVGEMATNVHLFEFDAALGRVGKRLQTRPTLPAGSGARGTVSGIDISAAGDTLVAGNRAYDGAPPPSDSLAVFAVDPRSGMLGPLELETKGIAYPRALAFEPGEGDLYVANQKGHSVCAYRLRAQALEQLWQVEVPMPMAVGFCRSFI